jgi:HPt (histidine-containing phosphotransfer) domain-containing protein
MRTTRFVDGTELPRHIAATLRELASRLGLDRTALSELLAVFVTASRADLETLLAAHRRGDGATVSEAAHSIKGAALSFGLTELADLASRVEGRVRSDSLDGIAADIAELEGHLRALTGLDPGTTDDD